MKHRNEFPKTLMEATRYFADKDKALAFVRDIRWPDGVVCPLCGSVDPIFLTTRRIWKCRACKKQFSVKVGTIFEDSAVALDKWLMAIWLIVNAKNGISSYELARAIGVTQKSAWHMNHRIRLALQNGTFNKLGGEVEVDETYIGGKARNMHHGKRRARNRVGGDGKSMVMGFVERGGKVVTKHIAKVNRKVAQDQVMGTVDETAKLFTDSLTAYGDLSFYYEHQMVNHAIEYVKGNVHTNTIENYWSLLKRTISGTYVSVEPFHLFRYLDEQAFRFNERRLNDPGRFVVAMAGIIGKRLTYSELTGKESVQ